MKNQHYILLFIMSIFACSAWAQGPPIRTDKPIMLGANKATIRTYYQYFKHQGSHYHIVPLMFEYNLKSNLELGVEIPFASVTGFDRRESMKPGDIMLKAKYQFLRKDKMGQTFRMAVKASEMFPTGRPSEVPHVGMGAFQTYVGALAGFESLKYGIVGELGYNHFSEIHPNYIESKISFGLPLKKPVYPVNQVTLYFEYEARWMPVSNDHAVYAAQGIQFAFKSYTIDLSLQVPLVEKVPVHFTRDIAVLIGGRFII
jgi:hypothetical protein